MTRNPRAVEGRAFLEELLKEAKKRKVCTIGKSCGASCVSGNKNCVVKLNMTVKQGLNSLSKEVERKKRARCEENWAELIVAAVLENPRVSNLKDILSTQVASSEPAYVQDLQKREELKVQQYIDTLKREIKGLNIQVDKVFLLGKGQDKYLEIETLQRGMNRKEKKADVIVKTKKGEYIGFSVKASSGATLTNYSIEKLLPNFSSQLKSARLGMLKDAGLPSDFRKSLRREYNDLYRGGRNPYHNLLRDLVVKNKEEVLSEWSKGLFSKTPFPIYSFDGNRLRANDSSSVKDSKFDLIPIENPGPRARGAAKIYFLITENGKPAYVWDVRWKGNTGFGSPQIQTTRVHEERNKVFRPFVP